MTTKQADKIIRTGAPVTVRSSHTGETFNAVFIARDRYDIRSATGGIYDRADLTVVPD